MTARHIIEQFLRMESARMHQPSACGFQLERLRLEMVNVQGGSNPSANEERNLTFAHLYYLIFKRLKYDERRVAFAAFTPKRHTHDCGKRSPTNPGTLLPDEADCTCGALVYYERDVRIGDLIVRERVGDESIQETRQGERVVRASRDKDGNKLEGWVRVAGFKHAFPDRHDIAAELGLAFWEVKKLLAVASAKLRDEGGAIEEARQ